MKKRKTLKWVVGEIKKRSKNLIMALGLVRYALRPFFYLLNTRAKCNVQLFRCLFEESTSLIGKAKGQLSQDVFALIETRFKRNGYFVDFGATNGVNPNNSYLLEKNYGWKGILAEPARCWHKALQENRKDAHIEFKCVWKESGAFVEFNEAEHPTLSTINEYTDSDVHSRNRNTGNNIYKVETISLNDLLAKYDAPSHIDFLSIDTEGSELDILQTVDYEKYTFSVIACEHNRSEIREKIYDLLTSKGYVRKYEEASGCDDWYVWGGR